MIHTHSTLQILLILPIITYSLYESNHLFPNNDEYELTILNPETMYGSPYGGFSRASASRLANFPLLVRSGFDDGSKTKKDNNKDDDNDDINQYFSISDTQGRKFSCKGYDKEDVLPEDMVSSMFDKVLVNDNNVINKKEGEELRMNTEIGYDGPHVSEEKEDNDYNLMEWSNNPKQLLALLNELYHDKEDDEHGFKQKMTQAILKEFYEKLDTHLTKRLQNICGQKHDGWWSYNYCYQNGVGQFHIETKFEEDQNSKNKNDKHGSLKASIDTMIRIGSFTKHIYAFSEDFSVVTLKESHDHGDPCDIEECTGPHCTIVGTKQRNAMVHLTCCDAKETSSVTGAVMLNQIKVLNIVETEQCSYKVHACSPSLCSEHWNFELKSLALPSYKPMLQKHWKNITKSSDHNNNVASTPSREMQSTMSVRDILRRVLVGRCLTRNEGWWTYEFCHEKHVRQFHSKTSVDPMTSKHRTVVETQHKLGYYHLPTTPDSEMIHNTTNMVSILSSASSNGADTGKNNNNPDQLIYYEMEYSQGDTCVHTDEDETTGSGFPEGMNRGTSVRFSCGVKYELLSVNEDSTCHYVMEITVPDLCTHPSFHVEVNEEPVYVIKCLH